MARQDKTDETDKLLHNEERESVSDGSFKDICCPAFMALKYILTQFRRAVFLLSAIPTTSRARQQYLHSARLTDSRESATFKCYP